VLVVVMKRTAMDPELQCRQIVGQELLRRMYRLWTTRISPDNLDASNIVSITPVLRAYEFICSYHPYVSRKCPCNMMERVTTTHIAISRRSEQADQVNGTQGSRGLATRGPLQYVVEARSSTSTLQNYIL
jgi:hypothetical protein